MPYDLEPFLIFQVWMILARKRHEPHLPRAIMEIVLKWVLLLGCGRLRLLRGQTGKLFGIYDLEYNPVTQKWTEHKATDIALSYVNAVPLNKHCFLVSGAQAAGGVNRRCYYYDIDTREYKPVQTLKTGGDGYLVAGGQRPVYIPPKPEFLQYWENGHWFWGDKTDVYARNSAAVMLRDGRALLIGGSTLYRGNILRDCWFVDLVTGVFSECAPLRIARCGHAAVVLPDGRILVAGGRIGWQGEDLTSSCEVYVPTANVWEDFPPLTLARDLLSLGVVENGLGGHLVMAVGGGYFNGSGLQTSKSVESYTIGDAAWQPAPSLPRPRMYAAMIYIPPE